MTLNLDRAMYRRAHEIVEGMRIARSKDPVEEAYADAISSDEESTEDNLYEINAERLLARAVVAINQRMGAGGHS